MVINLLALNSLLLLPSSFSFVVVDLDLDKKDTITVCHKVHIKKCELQTVEEMVPRMKQICWIETK